MNCTAGDVLRIVPPFVLTAEDVQDGLRILRQTIAVFPGCQSTTPPAA